MKVYFKKPIKQEKREFIFTSERVKKNVLICVVHCGCDSCRKRRVLTYQHTLGVYKRDVLNFYFLAGVIAVVAEMPSFFMMAEVASLLALSLIKIPACCDAVLSMM